MRAICINFNEYAFVVYFNILLYDDKKKRVDCVDNANAIKLDIVLVHINGIDASEIKELHTEYGRKLIEDFILGSIFREQIGEEVFKTKENKIKTFLLENMTTKAYLKA